MATELKKILLDKILPTENNTYCFLSIRRKFALKDALVRVSEMSNEEMMRPLQVKFRNEKSLSDQGGPQRELSTLIRHQLSESHYVTGREGLYTFSHDHELLQSKTYYNIGRLTAVLIVQSGCGLPIFSPPVAEYIITGKNTERRLTTADLTDHHLYKMLIQVLKYFIHIFLNTVCYFTMLRKRTCW